jgi:hypothetical protein
MVFLILGRMDPSYSSLIELLRQRDLPLTVVVIGDRPDAALSQIQSGENTGFLFIKTDDDLREVL